MPRRLLVPAALVLSLGCRVVAATPAQPAPDDGIGQVLRTLVADSLAGGGRRPGHVYVAADAASDTLLRAAGLAAATRVDTVGLVCPGSTDASGGPVAGEAGYVVRMGRARQASGALRLEVTVACSFVHRGEARRFAQGGTWDLARVSGRWRVTGLSRWIT